MDKLRKKKQVISELPLYHGILLFIREYIPIYKNMQRDMKRTYGDDLMNRLVKLTDNLVYCYRSTENIDKVKFVTDMLCRLECIATHFKVLTDAQEIQPKHYKR